MSEPAPGVIGKAVDAATVDPKRLTCAERLRYEGYLRREVAGEANLAFSRQGVPIKMIARTIGYSRKLVRNVVCGLIRSPADWISLAVNRV